MGAAGIKGPQGERGAFGPPGFPGSKGKLGPSGPEVLRPLNFLLDLNSITVIVMFQLRQQTWL